MPDDVAGRTELMIDEVTYETMKLTLGDMERHKPQGSRFMNPKTGKYTLARAYQCSACKKWIPCPAGDTLEDLQTKVATWKCPFCGKHPDSGAPAGSSTMVP